METLFIIFGVCSLSIILIAYLADALDEYHSNRVKERKLQPIPINNEDWVVSNVSTHVH